MHSVRKGSEPPKLKQVRAKRTKAWVRHYREGKGDKPTDSDWRRFADELGAEFSGLCGYCEYGCKGEVDHFRPKSKKPEAVYDWKNWVFACHDCNHTKSEKWPRQGYVFPCNPRRGQRPEDYFTFDTKTGEIVPRPDLDTRRWNKAKRMSDDLGLNRHHQLTRRLHWVYLVGEAVTSASGDGARVDDIVRSVTARHFPLSSITRVMLRERGIFDG